MTTPALTTHPRRSATLVRVVTAFALTVVISVFAAILGAPPAQAHDQLIDTDPVADSTVDALPAQIRLVYSGELIGDDGTATIIVTDTSGAELQTGAPVIDGAVVTQEIGVLDARGTITVTWRVVSGDGHPISGSFVFGVGEAPGTPAGPDTNENTSEGPGVVWIIIGVALIGLGGAVVYLLMRRARGAQD